MPSKKKQTILRLSETARALLTALTGHMGLNQTGVVETLIREKAKTEGVTAQEVATEATT